MAVQRSCGARRPHPLPPECFRVGVNRLQPASTMERILGIKFREYGQIYYFLRGGQPVAVGNRVLVETDQGQGIGEVVALRDDLPEDAGETVGDLKPVLRVADGKDMEQAAENEKLGEEARAFCNESIRIRALEMKLVDVEVYFDRSKIIFYFTAPTRIDFRELVKDLVKNYRTRIELRQIGVRHETQMIGAVGNCGMVCCCRRFLRKFAPVTIKMAKEQNLFLNPAKISGICGRLLCCLSYEQENYEKFHRRCPRLGKKYLTARGAVKVLRANMFRSSLVLLTETNEEVEVTLEEWQQMEPRRLDQCGSQGNGPSGDAGRDAGRDASEDAGRGPNHAMTGSGGHHPFPPDGTEGAGQSRAPQEASATGRSAHAPRAAARDTPGAAGAAPSPEEAVVRETPPTPGASCAAGEGVAAPVSAPVDRAVGGKAAVAPPAPSAAPGFGGDGVPQAPDAEASAVVAAQTAPAVAAPSGAAPATLPPPAGASAANAPPRARGPLKSTDPAALRSSRGRRKRKRRSSGPRGEGGGEG